MLKETRSLADKLNAAKDPSDVNAFDEFDAELADDNGAYRAFIVCRSTRRSEMLNLRLKNQIQRSFDYSHLYKLNLLPEVKSIVMEFSEHTVTISGLRLENCYQRLWSRRVLQITEADTPTAKLMMHENKEPVVTHITIEDRE